MPEHVVGEQKVYRKLWPAMPRNLGISLWAMRSHWKYKMHAGRGVLLEIFCRKGAREMECGIGREKGRERLEGGNTWTLDSSPFCFVGDLEYGRK